MARRILALEEGLDRRLFHKSNLGYALDLARELGLELQGAALADRRLAEAEDAGDTDRYWPVVARVIDKP